ncbi:MAG: hypothetical protein H7A33_00185 [Deltaproteobacteria bacterium]|nr:hypothetical protein [Deltaproteobacteria bacterium]
MGYELKRIEITALKDRAKIVDEDLLEKGEIAEISENIEGAVDKMFGLQDGTTAYNLGADIDTVAAEHFSIEKNTEEALTKLLGNNYKNRYGHFFGIGEKGTVFRAGILRSKPNANGERTTFVRRVDFNANEVLDPSMLSHLTNEEFNNFIVGSGTDGILGDFMTERLELVEVIKEFLTEENLTDEIKARLTDTKATPENIANALIAGKESALPEMIDTLFGDGALDSNEDFQKTLAYAKLHYEYLRMSLRLLGAIDPITGDLLAQRNENGYLISNPTEWTPRLDPNNNEYTLQPEALNTLLEILVPRDDWFKTYENPQRTTSGDTWYDADALQRYEIPEHVTNLHTNPESTTHTLVAIEAAKEPILELTDRNFNNTQAVVDHFNDLINRLIVLTGKGPTNDKTGEEIRFVHLSPNGKTIQDQNGDVIVFKPSDENGLDRKAKAIFRYNGKTPADNEDVHSPIRRVDSVLHQLLRNEGVPTIGDPMIVSSDFDGDGIMSDADQAAREALIIQITESYPEGITEDALRSAYAAATVFIGNSAPALTQAEGIFLDVKQTEFSNEPKGDAPSDLEQFKQIVEAAYKNRDFIATVTLTGRADRKVASSKNPIYAKQRMETAMSEFKRLWAITANGEPMPFELEGKSEVHDTLRGVFPKFTVKEFNENAAGEVQYLNNIFHELLEPYLTDPSAENLQAIKDEMAKIKSPAITIGVNKGLKECIIRLESQNEGAWQLYKELLLAIGVSEEEAEAAFSIGSSAEVVKNSSTTAAAGTEPVLTHYTGKHGNGKIIIGSFNGVNPADIMVQGDWSGNPRIRHSRAGDDHIQIDMSKYTSVGKDWGQDGKDDEFPLIITNRATGEVHEVMVTYFAGDSSSTPLNLDNE